VVLLLTTCNEHFQRVSMHGVRVELLEQQARAIGLPLQKMFVSQHGSNDEYLERMKGHLLAYKAQGVTRASADLRNNKWGIAKSSGIRMVCTSLQIPFDVFQ
jgi:diphthamide synthase (EF-2-diphthine--ammonia ligase)